MLRHSLLVASATAALLLPASFSNAQLLLPAIDLDWNGGISSPSREAARVFQSFHDDTFFTDIVHPTTLTGISFRLPAIANVSYPAADITFAQYEITLARPSQGAKDTNGLISDTFADNMDSPVVVRTGALTIAAGSLTDNNTGPGPDVAGQAPAEFSFVIPFATPYVLNPGEDLVVLIRQSGYGSPQQTNFNFDSYNWPNGGRVATNDVNATSGNLLPTTVTRYAFQMQRAAGDANGDGIVNADDLALIDRGAAEGRYGYTHGDFNSDNVIDAADYAIIHNALNPPAAAPLLSAIPEPASLSLLAASAILACHRRRRA